MATPFEKRPIAAELALCQRYYETGRTYSGGYGAIGIGVYHSVQWKVQKRTAPTLNYSVVQITNVSAYDIRTATVDQAIWYAETTAAGGYIWSGDWSAAAEIAG